MPYDPTIYEGAAAHYRYGRPPYSPQLEPALAEAAGLDGRGRLLDAGCGPGILSVRLAPLFEEVVGLDPDADMLGEGRRVAERKALDNIRWVQALAEDLPAAAPGPYRLVTFGQSFHWTDEQRVAEAVYDMLEPGGSLALIAHTVDGRPRPPGPGPPPIPHEEITALVARHLGSTRPATSRSPRRRRICSPTVATRSPGTCERCSRSVPRRACSGTGPATPRSSWPAVPHSATAWRDRSRRLAWQHALGPSDESVMVGSPTASEPHERRRVMPYAVDFNDVSTVGLESSPVASALAGLRAHEARYFKNKYDHVFTVEPASDATAAIEWVHRILEQERDIIISSRPLEATAFQVENIRIAYVFYESGLSINVMYTIDDPKKRAVGFKLSEGMDVPAELASRFKFARQKSKLAGTIRGSYFAFQTDY